MKPVVRVLPYKLYRGPNIRWCVATGDINSEPVALFYNKSLAIQCGKCLAKKYAGILYIHNTNGKIINVYNI